MDEFKEIRKAIFDLGLPIKRIWWEKRPFDEVMQFEFERSLTSGEWSIFEDYRNTIVWQKDKQI